MKILTIALNTFKECIRDKILYNLLIFAMLMIGLSAFLSKLTIGIQIRIVKDIGLASISIFGVLIAIFLGIGLVSKEIDRRTIYTILSKPVQRYSFLLGKFGGLLLTLFVNIAVMTVALIILIYSMSGDVNLLLFEAIFLIFIELIVVTSIALFFSTFTTPTLSAIFTLSFFVIGHLTGYIRLFGSQSDVQFVRKLSDILYYVLPNLESFNIKSMVMYAEALEWNLFFLSTMYGLIYTSLVLVFSIIIFQKRDFK